MSALLRELAEWRFAPVRARGRAEAWSLESYWREWPLLRAKHGPVDVMPRTVTASELAELSAARERRYEALVSLTPSHD